MCEVLDLVKAVIALSAIPRRSSKVIIRRLTSTFTLAWTTELYEWRMRHTTYTTAISRVPNRIYSLFD